MAETGNKSTTMVGISFAALLCAASLATAVPTALQKRQTHMHSSGLSMSEEFAASFELHESCNHTEANQLRFAFEETATLAAHARDHVSRMGNNSAIYRKYFGDFPPFEVIGAFEMVLNGDKSSLLFRCDDPDRNCATTGMTSQPLLAIVQNSYALTTRIDYAGHWRGENASLETVICARSFEERRELSQVCALGYNIAESSRLIFWASDMLHRLFHLPPIGYGYIEHFADGYEEIVTAAANGNADITHDTDALQYFALDAWAYDIANPGEGCPGPAHDEAETHSMSEMHSMSETSTVSGAASATPEASEVSFEDDFKLMGKLTRIGLSHSQRRRSSLHLKAARDKPFQTSGGGI